jgi:ATP-dependent exoDNAse (exonuclease V) alpha subunit
MTIAAITQTQEIKPEDNRALIGSIEHKKIHRWGLVPKQCQAVEMTLTNRVSLLSGFGGTGKTAILKAIYDLVIALGIVVHVAVLAGQYPEKNLRVASWM